MSHFTVIKKCSYSNFFYLRYNTDTFREMLILLSIPIRLKKGKMSQVTVVFCGPSTPEYSMSVASRHMKKILPGCETVLSTNDVLLYKKHKDDVDFDKVILSLDNGPLPSLKFTHAYALNNINRQISCTLEGVKAASNEIILKLRTDQLMFNTDILDLWKLSEENKIIPEQSRIITSSIFTINPIFGERMAYHISDMVQFGRKEDIVKYYSAPEFPIEYSIWYENNPYINDSTPQEKEFRAKYAVEQWIALHYLFDEEKNFPIKFHNDVDPEKILEFENKLASHFVIAHPQDIGLRPAKFIRDRFYYENYCYSTQASLKLISSRTGRNIEGIAKYKSGALTPSRASLIYKISSIPAIMAVWRMTPVKIKAIIVKVLKKQPKH